MSKFTLKSEHFTTPIKLVLPGIIISLIGASAGYYIFNNPEKNRAKATYSTWKVVKQFEDMLEMNSDMLPCSSGDQVQLKKDYVHLLEMTRQNMEDLKSEERIDKRLSAILNMKIDSYGELKKLTEVFLDSARTVGIMESKGLIVPDQKTAIISQMQMQYVQDLSHIINRDTSMTKNILKELNQSYSSYVDSFTVVDRTQTPEQIKRFIQGKWITSDKVTIDIQPAGLGHWAHTSLESDFTWTLTENILTIKLTKNSKQVIFEIIKINDHVITFAFDQNGNGVIANACRI